MWEVKLFAIGEGIDSGEATFSLGSPCAEKVEDWCQCWVDDNRRCFRRWRLGFCIHFVFVFSLEIVLTWPVLLFSLVCSVCGWAFELRGGAALRLVRPGRGDFGWVFFNLNWNHITITQIKIKKKIIHPRQIILRVKNNESRPTAETWNKFFEILEIQLKRKFT